MTGTILIKALDIKDNEETEIEVKADLQNITIIDKFETVKVIMRALNFTDLEKMLLVTNLYGSSMLTEEGEINDESRC